MNYLDFLGPHTPTARKIRRLLRFVQKRRIPMMFVHEYNNSIGHHSTREYSGIVKSYEVKKTEVDFYHELTIYVTFEDGSKMEETITDYFCTIMKVRPNPMRAMAIEKNNCDGTRDYFIMKRTDFE